MGRPTICSDRKILDEINFIWEETEKGPTYTELLERLPLESKGALRYRLLNLKKRGRVWWQPGEPRTIRVIER